MARISNSPINKKTYGKGGAVTLPFTPGKVFYPAAAPVGTYNPNISAEVEAHGNELNDFLLNEAQKDKVAGRNAAQTSVRFRQQEEREIADQRRNLGYDQADLGTRLGTLGINFERAITDLSTAKIRGQEDYSRTLTNLQHEYGSKAEQQSQNAIQGGVDEAGTNTASAAVRGANQAFDKGNVDLSHNRSEEDLAQQQGRDEADYARNVGLAKEGFGRQQEGANIQIGRDETQGRQNRNDNQRSYGELLHAAHTAASQATASQEEYEAHQGAASIYEANKLHPNLQFPGGSSPTTPTAGPHTAALSPAIGGSIRAPRPVGIGIGAGSRLRAPRY